MRRHELEHVLRAAKGITDEIEFVVIGSQAILAQIPDPPRLLTLETPLMEGAIGHCLHPVDVAYSKLAAGREKDFAFIRELIRCELIKAGTLENLIAQETETQELKDLLLARLHVCRRKTQSKIPGQRGS